jgi:hypothetical protein
VGLWDFCHTTLLPAFAAHNIDPAPLRTLVTDVPEEILREMWKTWDGQSLNGMVDMLLQNPASSEALCAIISRIDWVAFVDSLSAPVAATTVSTVLVPIEAPGPASPSSSSAI